MSSHPVPAGPWSLLCLVLAVILAAAPAAALDPGRHLSAYAHRMWQDELPQTSIHTVLQASTGYIYFGTYEGLVRFDGVRFTVYDADHTGHLAGGTVQHLREDSSARLWIATNEGLTIYENGSFNSTTVGDGLPSSFVTATAEASDGSVWVSTGAGLAVLRGGTITVIDDPDGPGELPIRTLVVDQDDVLWLATDNGLYRYADDRFSRLSTNDGLPDASVRALADGRDGSLWVGTNNGLVVWRDGRFEQVESANRIPSPVIRALFVDKSGTLWIGTEDQGLVRFLDGRFAARSAAQGLSHNYVRSIAEDREGGLWVGTNGGLNHLWDAKFAAYSTLEGLGNDFARTVFEDDSGALWIGSDGGGLDRLVDGEIRSFTTADGLANNMVRSIEQTADGALWVGTRGGVSRYSAGRFISLGEEKGLSNVLVRVVYNDHQGRLWVGTENGLNLWQGGVFETFTSDNGLVGNDVRALYQDSAGWLWIGTFSGVSRYRDGVFSSYTMADGMSSNTVFSFFEDRWGDLWIGTENGLNRFRDGRFSIFRTPSGLFDNRYFSFLEDDHGYLWMSSNRGVARVKLDHLHAMAEGELEALETESFDTADGMRTNQCNGASQPAGWKGRDGKLWFPTPRGVIEVDPANLRRNLLPPAVRLEEVVVGDQVLDPAQVGLLPPGTESLVFHYTALSFPAPPEVHFRYQLQGFDSRWVEAGTRRAAYYTNLPPGRFTFKVVACNDDGVWNLDGAELTLEIGRAAWQTWWAYLLYGLAGLGLISAGVRLRLSAMARRTRLLEAMVAERTAELDEKNAALAEKVRQLEISERYAHISERRALEANRAKSVFLSNMSHELRTPLNSIIGFSSILEKKLPEVADERTLKFVRNIHGSGQHLLGLINDLLDLSKIEAGKMEVVVEPFDLATVIEETQRVMHGVTHRKGITIVHDLAADLPKLNADRGKLKQILFNLLSNAVKFSSSGAEVIVRGRILAGVESPLATETVRIDVVDHGVGIARKHHELIFEEFRQLDGSASREYEGTGLGLALVRRLLELQGGQIELESSLGQGSTFSVFLPLFVQPVAETSEPPALVWSRR